MEPEARSLGGRAPGRFRGGLDQGRSAGGELRADNVRLSHVECNQRDHTRRKQIGALLLAGESLEDIADTLNRKKTPAFHGTKRWTAAMVREAYVS